MGLSCGQVDLRCRWEARKVIAQRHSIWLSRSRIVAIGRGGSPLGRHCWQIDTRPTSASICHRPIVAHIVSFTPCHNRCVIGKILDIRG